MLVDYAWLCRRLVVVVIVFQILFVISYATRESFVARDPAVKEESFAEKHDHALDLHPQRQQQQQQDRGDLSPTSRPSGNGTRPRIAMFVMAQGDSSFKNISIDNKKEYASKHGYDLILQTSMDDVDASVRNMHPTWGKVGTARIQLRNYDWMWLIDLDAMIMNMNTTIESIVSNAEADKIDILIAKDCNGINAGSLFLRNSDFTKELLPIWLAMETTSQGGRHGFQEQQSLSHLIDTNFLDTRSHVQFMPQTMFNSYPDSHCHVPDQRGRYEPGDFVLHFVAWFKNDLVDIMEGKIELEYQKE